MWFATLRRSVANHSISYNYSAAAAGVAPAVVTAAPLPGGKAEVHIVAVEGEPGGETVVVRDERGAEHRVPLAAVTQARLAFHWKNR